MNHLALLAFALLALPPAHAADVSIAEQNGARHVRTPNYEATVGADGCLFNFKIGGIEFLASSVSRGTYFYQDELVGYSSVDRVAEKVITARGQKAAARYEFGTNTVSFELDNLTDQPLVFFAVLDPGVRSICDETGAWQQLPVNLAATNGVYFCEKARLEVSGTDKLWGPWEGDHQVLQVSLAPKQHRRLVFKAGTASADETNHLAQLPPEMAAPVVEPDLTVLSPRNWQVIQRQSKLRGRVIVSGRVKTDCDAVEASFAGRSLEGPLSTHWQSVPLVKATRSFFVELPLPAGGWYRVEVRALRAGKPVAKTVIDKVGVGEVFVGAGQSNSTNSGDTKTRQTSGMVASFSGTDWRSANDPQPGTHDRSQGGSFWPAFGDAMFARYGVPIGVATTGHGGTSVNAWKPGDELFNWTMNRVAQLGPGGFRAVLWHQGETDVSMNTDDYARKLTALIRASTTDAGWQFPWFVARVSYHNPEQRSFDTTRSAQKKLWEEGVALEGPDTDTLTGDNRDQGGQGIHFSPKGLAAHGTMWAERVSSYLDKVLNE